MYHFIVNPNSRSGKGRLLWNKIYNELESKNVDYKIYFTEIENNGTKIAHEITKDYHECNIIAIGGDGTVNKVVPYVQQHHLKIVFHIQGHPF